MSLLWRRDGIESMRVKELIGGLIELVKYPLAWLSMLFLGTIFVKIAIKVIGFAWSLPI